MSVKIEFKTGNDAFRDPGEIGRLLRNIAAHIDNGYQNFDIRDLNGGVVGTCMVE